MEQSWIEILVQTHPLAAVAVVFVLDGLGIPLLPEVAVLLAFFQNQTWGFAIALLVIAALVEAFIAGILYVLTGLVGMPRWLNRLMDGYSGSLLVSDERLVLLNRLVPVLPVVGAFIRVRGWNPAKAIGYVALGSVAKYGILILGSKWALDYFHSDVAMVVSLGLAGAFVALSWGYALRKWVVGRRERATGIEIEAA